MTAHERETIQDRCARCDGAPDAQALLAEARAQLEEARRERDEARRSSEYLHAKWTEMAARADALEEQLAEARLAAEQGVKVAEALAAEKAALLQRVAVLEAALDRAIEGFEAVRRSNHQRGHDACDEILPELRAALEVEP